MIFSLFVMAPAFSCGLAWLGHNFPKGIDSSLIHHFSWIQLYFTQYTTPPPRYCPLSTIPYFLYLFTVKKMKNRWWSNALKKQKHKKLLVLDGGGGVRGKKRIRSINFPIAVHTTTARKKESYKNKIGVCTGCCVLYQFIVGDDKY